MKISGSGGWRGTVIIGFLALLAGLYGLLVAIGFIPPEAVGLRAPPWTAAVAGGVFGLAGAVILLMGMAEREGRSGTWTEMLFSGRGWAAAAIITLMAIMGGWIAFGPGEREFEGGFSLLFLTIEGLSPEFQGRCIFGIGTILAGLIAAYAWVDAVRGRYRGRADEPDEAPN